MLLEGFAPIVEAQRAGRAVPGFVAYNLETAQGIVSAAEQTGMPLLIQAGSSAFRHAGRRELALLCLDLARHSSATIGVHLDHCRSMEEIEFCLGVGYTSVMIDSSHLPYEENVALTAEVARRAHDHGAWVEAELVGTAGDEDVSVGATAEAMTDPALSREFVAATGIDALAVAIGNVHGFTPVEPRLDLARLDSIREMTRIPLVLHGASGLAPETLLACVQRGVAKVNVNAELRRAYLTAVSDALPQARATADLAAPLAAGRGAVADAAATIVRVLGRLEHP